MKQLNLMSEIVKHRKRPKTKNNVELMKKCFSDVHKLGMVSGETMQKVLNTDYLGDLCH